jgi:hypothetical protein
VSAKDHFRKIDTEVAAHRSQLARLEEAVRSIPSQPSSPPQEKKLPKVLPWVAIIVSVISALIAYKQSQTASNALHVSQRPYVLPGKIVISCDACEHPIAAPQKFPVEANAAIIFSVVNYGKTPAYDFKINVTRFIPIAPLSPDFDFPEDPDGNDGPHNLPPDPNTPLTVVLPERAEHILLARHKMLRTATKQQQKQKGLLGDRSQKNIGKPWRPTEEEAYRRSFGRTPPHG